MMEVDKKKTRTDEAWVRLYARFETDCLLPADAEHAPATHRRLYLKWGSVAAAVIAGIVCLPHGGPYRNKVGTVVAC